MKTIKSKEEISRLFKQGRRIKRPSLNFIVMKRDSQHDHSGRAAFITGKKLGNAVWRNRAKRRMRHALHETGQEPVGYDVLIMAKRSTNSVPFSQLKREIEEAFGKVH